MIVTASDVRWLRSAIAQAERAAHTKWRVGAVVVRGGSLVGRGCNRYRNNPAVVHYHGVSYHAEDVALRKAGSKAMGGTIYVARLTTGGNLGLAKPCQRCQAMLTEFGIDTVVWTTSAGMQKARLSEVLHVSESQVETIGV